MDWFIKQFYAAELASKSASELFEQLESEMHSISPGSDHLIFTPWFLGERCPVSTTVTRITLFNLSHEHTRGHLARALCEGIAYNIRWKLEIMEHQFGFKQDELRIIGGGSQNDTWMQILANVTQKKIVKTNQPRHAGAIGGAMCAMVGSGVYPNFESVHQLIQPAQIFQPQKEHFDIYDTLFLQYKSLYHSLKNLYSSANQNRF